MSHDKKKSLPVLEAILYRVSSKHLKISEKFDQKEQKLTDVYTRSNQIPGFATGKNDNLQPQSKPDNLDRRVFIERRKNHEAIESRRKTVLNFRQSLPSIQALPVFSNQISMIFDEDPLGLEKNLMSTSYHSISLKMYQASFLSQFAKLFSDEGHHEFGLELAHKSKSLMEDILTPAKNTSLKWRAKELHLKSKISILYILCKSSESRSVTDQLDSILSNIQQSIQTEYSFKRSGFLCPYKMTKWVLEVSDLCISSERYQFARIFLFEAEQWNKKLSVVQLGAEKKHGPIADTNPTIAENFEPQLFSTKFEIECNSLMAELFCKISDFRLAFKYATTALNLSKLLWENSEEASLFSRQTFLADFSGESLKKFTNLQLFQLQAVQITHIFLEN